MRILFATDGSLHAKAALRTLIQRPWPKHTSVRVISVARPWPLIGDPMFTGAAIYVDHLIQEEHRAEAEVKECQLALLALASDFSVSTAVREGDPVECILEEALAWRADLIVLGAHGKGTLVSMVLGSVARGIADRAPCSVEIVRLSQLQHDVAGDHEQEHSEDLLQRDLRHA